MKTCVSALFLMLMLVSCSDNESEFPCELVCKQDVLIFGLDNGEPTKVVWDDIVDDFEGDCEIDKIGIDLFDMNGNAIDENVVDSEYVNDTLNAIITYDGDKAVCSGEILVRDFNKEELLFEENKITCLNCHGFGNYIEVDGEFLFIADFNTIWVVRKLNEGYEFIQKIEASTTHSIRSLIAKDGMFAFGSTSGDDEGSVYVYELLNDQWVLKQQLSGTANGSDFGSSIDIFADRIVVGASAVWSSTESKVFVFKKEEDSYIFEAEFEASDPSSGNRFGEAVAIQDNFIFASSVFSKLHVYEFKEDTWTLSKIEDYSPSRIRHDNSQFMMITEQDIIGFRLEINGSFVIQEVIPEFYKPEIAGHGEVIDIKGDLALLVVQDPGECYSVQFDGNSWIHERQMVSFDGDVCAFAGVEITEDYLIVGGDESDNPYPMGYIYIIDR